MRILNTFAAALGAKRRVPSQLVFNDNAEIESATSLDNDQRIRGIFWRLLDIRANALYSGLMQSTVERQISQTETLEVEQDHPWVQLLRTPDPVLDRFSFWYSAFLSYDIYGEVYMLVERDGLRVPRSLLLINPIRHGLIVPVVDRAGRLDHYRLFSLAGTFELDISEVIRIYRPHPQDELRAASLLEVGMLEIDKDYWQQRYARDVAREGRYPPGYLTTDQELDPEMLEQYARMFKAKYMDASRSGRELPALAGGLRLETTGVRPADVELTEGRKLTLTELFYLTGVPEGLPTDRSNRSNAEAARKTFADITIQPILNAVCQSLTYQFERIFGSEPGVLRIVPADISYVSAIEQAEIDRINISTGKITINELRKRDGWEPFDLAYADEPLVSTGLIPLSMSGLG